MQEEKVDKTEEEWKKLTSKEYNFDDGSRPSRNRYCVNSLSLDFRKENGHD